MRKRLNTDVMLVIVCSIAAFALSDFVLSGNLYVWCTNLSKAVPSGTVYCVALTVVGSILLSLCIVVLACVRSVLFKCDYE